MTIYGGEAVRHDGRIVGRVRSCAYGYTVGAMVGLASLDAGLPEGAQVSVDAFETSIGARVRSDVLYDPAGERLRG